MNKCLAPVLFNIRYHWGYWLIIARTGPLADSVVINELYYDISDSMYFVLERVTAPL
jgi:hypothetical protein